MMEIIGYLTKMRFGDEEQSNLKDTKEARLCSRLKCLFFYLFSIGAVSHGEAMIWGPSPDVLVFTAA